MLSSFAAATTVLFTSVECRAVAKRWDYVAHPIKVSENHAAPAGAFWFGVQFAFDGFGAQGSRPASVRAWHQPVLPSETEPLVCEIDYLKPVAVSAFVHYFYVPDGCDMRYGSPMPTAFRSVRVSSRQDDGEWQEDVTLRDMPAGCPQVIPVNASKPARFWRIEVLGLAIGASGLLTYEIQTYTGGVPEIDNTDTLGRQQFSFSQDVIGRRPSAGHVARKIGIEAVQQSFSVHIDAPKQTIDGKLELLIGDAVIDFKQVRTGVWNAEASNGTYTMKTRTVPMGLLFDLSFNAANDNPIVNTYATLRLSVPKVDQYYIPLYAWSRDPVDNLMVNACVVPTRMAGVHTGDTMVCLVPATDRGSLGFSNGMLASCLLLGSEPTEVMLTAIEGDWWDAYKFVSSDIYGFTEQRQSVPVSEIQYGTSRFLLSEDIWEPILGTLKSWPASDPHTHVVGYFDAFNFYGAPYSVPAYWNRYVMNGDELARTRCRDIVHWLCRSGVRIQDGPVKGAFFSSQRFSSNEKPSIDKQGCTQANSDILTSQATGAALWSLLYYRNVSGEADPEVDKVIEEAMQWLLKTQTPEGGWPYGHDIHGNAFDYAPSSGCIWNIWALWRLGKQTGNRQCLEAADKGKRWYAETFTDNHFYHGYWEDVGPSSHESYDAAVASVAFADMGEDDLSVRTACDAVQSVFTRRIAPREENCSAGLVAEQTGWPPAAYCNPMVGLASWNAWRITGDDYWRSFAMIPKAIGWWYQPESGAMVWIVDATQMAPIAGPSFESWWTDWVIAQVSSLTTRWLVREVGRRSQGTISIDEETLKGKVLGSNATAWAPPGGFSVAALPDRQFNWFGFRTDDSVKLAVVNYGDRGSVACHLDSRSVTGGTVWPKAVHRIVEGKVITEKWDGKDPVHIAQDDMVILEWGVAN